ncbi:hypothetical protein CANDROIZ_130027 [Candidatus Roizmanbacteria bacterium]|nr:hypothetical protein CANDROIZ_130027 [Candidatus Roizmanbacteria bacterium]
MEPAKIKIDEYREKVLEDISGIFKLKISFENRF